MAIFDQYFQNSLSPSVQTCPKDRFYQVLHFSLAFMYGNVEILKIRAKMVEKAHFFKNMFFSKSLKIILLLQKLSQKHEIWTRYAESQCLKNVGGRFLYSKFFLRFCRFLVKNQPFWKINGKISGKKIKNSKIYFKHFLGTMVLHIWSCL